MCDDESEPNEPLKLLLMVPVIVICKSYSGIVENMSLKHVVCLHVHGLK